MRPFRAFPLGAPRMSMSCALRTARGRARSLADKLPSQARFSFPLGRASVPMVSSQAEGVNVETPLVG